MTTLPPLPATFASTRDDLKRVAVHVVARARQQATGRFGLRSTVGGFGTPEFGGDLVRVRVSGGLLVREAAGTGGATSASIPIHGATVAELAAHANADLDADLDVGHDTPAMGDRDAALTIDTAAADALATWFATVSMALDRVVAELSPGASPTSVQLWPEHFDVALDAGVTSDRRVNLGGSPGDGFMETPYAYVGPWTEDRPGDESFWNAPFGAVRAYDEVANTDDPVGELTRFYLAGMRRLAD